MLDAREKPIDIRFATLHTTPGLPGILFLSAPRAQGFDVRGLHLVDRLRDEGHRRAARARNERTSHALPVKPHLARPAQPAPRLIDVALLAIVEVRRDDRRQTPIAARPHGLAATRRYELLERPAALTPRSRINLLRYYGVPGGRPAWRARLQARGPDTVIAGSRGTTAAEASSRGPRRSRSGDSRRGTTPTT